MNNMNNNTRKMLNFTSTPANELRLEFQSTLTLALK